MIGFLRLLGLLNAAVWLGAAVSFTFAFGPTFFSQEFKATIPEPHNGFAAQMVMKRYFILHYCCGGIALLHLILEKLYLGKVIERFMLIVLAITVSLGVLGGIGLQPKLRELHLKKYNPRATPAARAQSDSAFKMWHGVSQTMNLIILGGLVIYFWRISNTSNGSRFISAQKFRG